MRPSDANSPFGVSHRFPENMVLIESPIRLPRKVLSARATTSRSNPLPQLDAKARPQSVRAAITERSSAGGAGSPLKSTIRAVRDAAGGLSRRVPLGTMLERLERAVAPTIPRAPAKVAPTRASSSSTTTIRNKATSRKQFSTTLSATPTQPSSKLSYNQVRIAELYESFILRQEVESARVKYCAADAVDGGAPSSASSLAEASKVPGTFMDVLKVYYPSFSKTTLEMMVHDAKDAIQLVDRRRFIAKAKGPLADRLRLAFVNSDKDKSGCLELNEFIDTVKRSHAQPPGYCKDKRATPDELHAILTTIFTAGDVDSDGCLSFEEFLEMVAKQPWLIQAFDRIIELGVTRKLKNEQMRLQTLFRHPVSPRSRCIVSPGGRKFRPGLVDLRRADEVGEVLARAEAEGGE